ncbi:F-box/FBD/LRR-repeat protein At4g26340-like [Pistacia vera]|uniref:F-box/FBD/LRR-repeat protein At4g26340-like n=1 Tax=Pistacia vera TaxID=55513 RepID=UPI001262CCAF|nr:F-box/FBD/LRR-repeat protein At4g26340-like [Pistacia vera]
MEIDRISCLHDSILYKIFSFLPAKDVLQTTLLSKSLQDLWKPLPHLDFDESDFTNEKSFTNFVDKFLLHRGNSISIIRLRLLCGFACRSCDLETWISAAFTARVHELQLCSKYKAIGDGLPSSLFNCKSLVTLRLNIGYVVRFPDNFCFPNMKIIDFCDVHFGKNFSDQLLNSKNLEEIYFMHCRIDIDNSSSPSSLTVREDVVADDSHCSGTFPNLNKATIVLGKHPGKEEETGFCASKFIKTLSNANVLYLSNACIQLLQYCGGNLLDYLPTFCNLKRLQLTVSIKDGDIGVLSCLLDRSPILESLGIRFFNYKFRSLVSRCNRELKRGEYARHLECIRMEHFRGSKNQVELVRFFLANAQVLKKMSLYSDREFPLSLDLFEFPRLSTSCQLLIY